MNPMSIMAQAEKLGIPELQRSIQNGVVPAFIGVPLLQEKVKRQRQMQMGMAAQQPKRPSVAEQVGQEAQQVSVEDMMRERARMMQGEMGQTGGISDFLPKSESFSAGGAVARVLKSVGGAVDVMALPTLIDTLTAENPDDIAAANKRRAEDKKSKDLDEPDGYVGADIKNHAKGGIIAFAENQYVDPEFVGEWNPPSEAEFYAREQQRKLREKNRSMFDAMQANNATQYRYLPSPEGKTWDQFNEALGASNYEALPYHIPSREMAAAEDNYMSLGKSNLQATNTNAIMGRLLADPKAAESQFGFSKPNEYGLFPDIERLRKLPLAKGNDPDYNRVQSKPAPELRAQPITPPVSTQTQPAITPTAPTTVPAQAMQNRIAARKALPVAGSVVPAVQTPYAQAVQAAPSQPAVEPQTTAEPIMSAVERAKLFKEALGEDIGRADTMKRLAEREAATAKQEERAPWLALMQAGLATMAGTSPFAMANIGAGGVAGLNAYMKAQDKLDTAKENHDAVLAQLNKAQRAEDIAAYKFGADSEQADKALAAREKLQDKELASREKMNREDNAVRREGYAVNREIAGMRMSNTGVSGDLKPYQADQLRKSAVSAADKVLSNMLSPEYKEFNALKTKAEKDQYKQNLVDSYFAKYTGAVPSAPAAAQAQYDLNWVP